MIGIDTSFLIALVVAEHEYHQHANAMLREAVGRAEDMALTPAVVAEFLHAVTDPRRFSNPLTMTDALADARFWWSAQQVRRVLTTPRAMELCFEWMTLHQLGRKRILDTMLAATLHAADVRRLFTLNPTDFRVFSVFELLAP